MSQPILSRANDLQYAVTHTYYMLTNEKCVLKNALNQLKELFKDDILIAVGKQLHQLLTDEMTQDVPSFPNFKEIPNTQTDLLIYIQLDKPLTIEKIQIKKIMNNIFKLTDQKVLYSPELDITNKPHVKSSCDVIADSNNNCYLFSLRYITNYQLLKQLTNEQLTKLISGPDNKYAHNYIIEQLLLNYKLIIQNFSDSQQGVNVLGFGQELLTIQEVLKDMFSLNSEYYDQYFVDYCQIVQSGFYYVLNNEQLSFGQQIVKQKLLDEIVNKKQLLRKERSKWPKKDGDDEEQEEPVEEKEDKEDLEEKEEKEEKEEQEEGKEEAEAEEKDENEKMPEPEKIEETQEKEQLEQKDQKADGGEEKHEKENPEEKQEEEQEKPQENQDEPVKENNNDGQEVVDDQVQENEPEPLEEAQPPIEE